MEVQYNLRGAAMHCYSVSNLDSYTADELVKFSVVIFADTETSIIIN